MGGFGSGRQHGGKAVTSSYLCIDAGELKKAGALIPGSKFLVRFASGLGELDGETEEGRVWFMYALKHGDDCQEVINCVTLSTSPGQFGGQRPWFVCPSEHCGKRVKKLYIAEWLGCRHCLSLSYQSKNESYSDRMVRKADKVRERLGWSLGILNPVEGRPKGMHFRTYIKLLGQYYRLRY